MAMRRKFLRQCAAIGGAALLLAGCETVPPGSAEQAVTVWHTMEQADAEVLRDAVASYQESTGRSVELVAFESPAALRDERSGERQPDVYFGPHTWVRDRLEHGLAAP